MTDLSKRRVGRPPKYDWLDKRDLCHKLYVEEHRSPAEIIKYFTEHFSVDEDDIPCRKGFHRQFQVWGFPTHIKKLTSDEEVTVLTRMHELWEQNVNQKDIKATLGEEGFELKAYEFNKLWRKAGLRLRNDNGYKAPDVGSKKRKRSSEEVEDGDERERQVSEADAVAGAAAPPQGLDPLSAPLTPDQAALRAQRLHEIQVESDQRLAARKRRRRIRGYGHLPPDAPGTAPRYASETSLDECKAYLHLSNEMYNTVRKDFATLCEELDIVKKTLCAEGVWEESKQRLISENLHLSAMMHPLQPNQDKKGVALDCLCADVTKRLRVKGRAITIAEANNVLDLNPTESKAVRRSFYEILAAANFESKLVSGDEQWNVLRERWYDSAPKLRNLVDEKDERKMKCLDLLCSDAMKRFREDKNKRGERQVVQRNARYGPGPGPAWAATAPRSKKPATELQAPRGASKGQEVSAEGIYPEGSGYPFNENESLLSTLAQHDTSASAIAIDFDIDPALTAAPAIFPAAAPPMPVPPPPQQQQQQYPAYFRLAPESHLVGYHPRMWLGKLASASLESLRQAATSKIGAATVGKVHGVVKTAEEGGEDRWLIESDEELGVYLGEAGEKATFVVLLQGGYA